MDAPECPGLQGRGKPEPPNKGMKQTKPAQAMELRSLSPVLCGQRRGRRGPTDGRATLALQGTRYMGAITVRRTVVGTMSALVFALGLAAFVLGFLEPMFYPLAWLSLLGGLVIAVLLWLKHSRSSHPSLSHELEGQPEEHRPIHPR